MCGCTYRVPHTKRAVVGGTPDLRMVPDLGLTGGCDMEEEGFGVKLEEGFSVKLCAM